jgi:hypothetical protein
MDRFREELGEEGTARITRPRLGSARDEYSRPRSESTERGDARSQIGQRDGRSRGKRF